MTETEKRPVQRPGSNESALVARRRRAIRLILEDLYKWRRYPAFPYIFSEGMRGTAFEERTLESIENELIQHLDKWSAEDNPERARVHEIYFTKGLDIIGPRAEAIVKRLRADYRSRKQVTDSMSQTSANKAISPELVRLKLRVREAKSKMDHLERRWQSSTSYDRQYLQSQLNNARGIWGDAKLSLERFLFRS